MAAEVVDAIPLSTDTNGVYRIGGGRVTLDLVVRAFNRGATAEEIAQDFPSLQLSDIYQSPEMCQSAPARINHSV